MNKIRCLVRNELVRNTKEERVRQALLFLMIEQLGYPRQMIAVEKDIQNLPHLSLSQNFFLKRRADIICYSSGIRRDHELFPLLIVECKADRITDKAKRQLMGYNLIVKAPFIALAGKERIATGWYDSAAKKYKFIDFLPKFEDLRRVELPGALLRNSPRSSQEPFERF